MILANFAIPALNLNFINTANQLNIIDRIINIGNKEQIPSK